MKNLKPSIHWILLHSLVFWKWLSIDTKHKIDIIDKVSTLLYMIRKVLKNLGLSENEIKVYLTVLSLGQLAISSISKKTWLKRTTNYSIVEKLAKEWILTYYEKQKVKYYSALDPELLLEKYEQKINNAQASIRDLKSLLPTLIDLKNSYSNKAKIWYYEGEEGIKSMLNMIVHDKPTEVRSFLSVEEFSGDLIKYLKNDYFPGRLPYLSAKNKTITLKNAKHDDYISNDLHVDKWEIKQLNQDEINLHVNFMLYDNKVWIYSNSDGEMSWILIESDEVYKTFIGIFDYIWKTIK